MRTNRIRVLPQLLVIAALIAYSSRALAFCYAPQLKVSDEYFLSDMVVTVTVLSAHNVVAVDDTDGVEGTFYRLEVGHVYRGAKLRYVRMYSENTTARFPLELGKRYLLFLHSDPEHRGVFWVDNCGNSELRDKAHVQLEALKSISLSQSFVYGEVFSYDPDITSQLCLHVRLSLNGPVNQDVSMSPDCSFSANVPPGTYKALAWLGKERLLSYELPYKNPYCFRIPKGGSAGIAFRLPGTPNQETLIANKADDEQLQQLCEAERHPSTQNVKLRTECVMSEAWMAPCHRVAKQELDKGKPKPH